MARNGVLNGAERSFGISQVLPAEAAPSFSSDLVALQVWSETPIRVTSCYSHPLRVSHICVPGHAQWSLCLEIFAIQQPGGGSMTSGGQCTAMLPAWRLPIHVDG